VVNPQKELLVELPTLRDGMTTGELYGPAMKITDQDTADEYFAALIKHSQEQLSEHGKDISKEQIAEMIRNNLGYFAGYHGPAVRERVATLFGAQHPIFGVDTVTAAQAFERGRQLAEELVL
jgi:hypothetical protein